MKLARIFASTALALTVLPHDAFAQSAAQPIAGVQTATLTAAALPAAGLYSGVVLKADYGNTGIIFIGPCSNLTTTTGYPLEAGEAISYGVTSLSLVCMIGQNTSDVLHFTGN
ncbi:hypothetical protein [Rhodoblastus sp.]|uniref:hypothetical protein n=1 Tax=Rhodoblastus sp. TaxID=1962975 RepID=UPI003F9E646D